MKRVMAPNGAVYAYSEQIPAVHGFSTRLGGYSTLPHTAGCNLGFDRGDGAETVLQNLHVFAEAVGFKERQIVSAVQIHSAKVRYVTPDQAGEGWYAPCGEPCDGLVTDRRGVVLGVRTADCVPILLYAPPHQGFGGAVAACHAGWRGTAAGIVRVAVEELVRLGAVRETVRAAIGAAIGTCCYEVREDFLASFCQTAGEGLTAQCVCPAAGRPGVYRADLKKANRILLRESGVRSEHMDCSVSCTACSPHLFYSHRASGGKRGSMLSVITLDPPVPFSSISVSV